MSTGTSITDWASTTDGQFRRQVSSFRASIAPNTPFPPAPNRYRLYVSYACPWAHRTLILRSLKGLEDAIDIVVVGPHMGELGWPFKVKDAFPGAQDDPEGSEHLRDLYFKAEPNYNARFTVPVLWDKEAKQIVNNESSEIIRILNHALDEYVPADKKALDFYPEELRKEIDELNEWVYDTVNNGVYKCGFATTQQAYESNVVPLFASLDRLEKILASNGGEYLIGGRLTEADIRLYTTIVRFDPVYVGHFKCNIGTIRHNYPHLHKWLRKLYWTNPAFKDTTNFEHIKEHYYWSHTQINPKRIIPKGPIPNIEPL